MKPTDAYRLASLPHAVQAANSGGFDFVLLHPEYLRDRSGSSLLVTLMNNGVKLAAYGWEPSGFARELIEGAGISYYIMGPTQQGLDINSLSMLVAEMQGVLPGMQGMGASSAHGRGIMVRCSLGIDIRQVWHASETRQTVVPCTSLKGHSSHCCTLSLLNCVIPPIFARNHEQQPVQGSCSMRSSTR
jgi:hypothetical protein